MARKDIFDRIDSKMRSQIANIGRVKKDETGDDAEYVEKRVSRRVIRRRARKPSAVAPEEVAAPTATVEEGAATAAAPEVEAPPAVETTPDTLEDEAPAVEPEPSTGVEPAKVSVEDGEVDAAADPTPEPEPEEPVAEVEPAAIDAEAPPGAEKVEAEAEPADVSDHPEPEAEPTPEVPEELSEAAVVGEIPVEETTETQEAVAEEALAGAGVQAADPDLDDENKPTDSQMELEELLKQQGIVQHKPKKGRRIIAEAPMPERRPIPKPIIRQDIRAQQMMKQARQAGYTAENQPAAGQPRDGRRRTLGQDRLERDLRDERDRERRFARASGKKRQRKSIVQRPDMVFYPGRRSTRKKAPPRGGISRKVVLTTPKAAKRVIRIDNEISVGELAKELGLKAPELIRKFIELGQMVTLNQFVDVEAASLAAAEFDYRVEDIAFKEEEVIVAEEDAPEDLQPRPAVITVMGHVDHGKTSILDTIRNSRVAAREAGGITQHIGAYQVDVGGQMLTFLDTPGHEAFTAMRMRGAECTDLVVLVVAANDGVMPQTIEAINHARAAGVPILVAINKMDLANINVDRVHTELSEQELTPEAWGGDTIMVPVSATKNTGIDELLEMIALQADMLELSANPDGALRGVVIEGKLSKGVGPVATALVQRGTVRQGEFVVAGTAYGRVRALRDFNGKPLKQATPSMPVEIHGLSSVPEAGDEVVSVEDERAAKMLVEHRQEKLRAQTMSRTSRATMDTLNEILAAASRRELCVILKADVHGSVEAVRDALGKIEVENTVLNIQHAAVGGITESDVMLASASNGMVIGFNVRPDGKAAQLGDQHGVDIRTYRVIYELLEEVESMMLGMLEPVYEEKVEGRAEVRDKFKVPKIGVIAGCHVADGTVARNHSVRLLRAGVVVYEGKMASLKRFKDDVKEVSSGYECGISLSDYQDIKKGDVIETYTVHEVARA